MSNQDYQVNRVAKTWKLTFLGRSKQSKSRREWILPDFVDSGFSHLCHLKLF